MGNAKANRHRRVGPHSLWAIQRDFQIRFLRSQGLEPSSRIVDFGCGTLRGGLPILRHVGPANYTGVDVCEDNLTEARAECHEAGLAPPQLLRWRADLQLPPVDFVWAFSVLIHLGNPTLNDVFRWVTSHLQPRGAFYANINVGAASDAPHTRYSRVAYRPLPFYQERAARAGLTLTDLGSLADLGHSVGRPAFDSQRMIQCTHAS